MPTANTLIHPFLLAFKGPAASLLLLFSLCGAAVAEPTFRVGLFNPHDATDSFWSKVEAVVTAAAEDLDIELKIYRADFDHRLQIRQFERAITEDRIQAALFGDYRQNGLELIRQAEAYQIPVVLFDTPLSFHNLARTGGGPRQNFRYWIGEIVPDEATSGYQLAFALHQLARRRGFQSTDGRVAMIAISGDLSDNSSVERIRGLQRYATIHEATLDLKQVVNAPNWSRSQAQFQFKHLLRRYPDSRVVWAASDSIAFGVLDAIAAQDGEPGQQVLGDIGWTEQGFEAINQGSLHVSLGGHFLQGGWALVLLHDYLHGKDFASIQGTLFSTQLLPVGRDRIAAYSAVLRDRRWAALDFRRYSRVHHPELTQYSFDIRSAMEDLAGSAPSTSTAIASPSARRE